MSNDVQRGAPRERILGVKMPAPNLTPDFEQQARGFIERVADRKTSQDPVPAAT